MKYIAFLSFGKDSIAQLIKIKELGLPLDEVVYVDIRYTPEISGEHPIMAEWIPTAEKIIKEKLGITVKHLAAQYSFREYFYRKKEKGDHKGEIYGFPFVRGAWCNSRMKLDVIKKYENSLNDEITEYVGIAFDEVGRMDDLLARSTKKLHKRSVLFELEITEKDAFDICAPYNLISPIYKSHATRTRSNIKKITKAKRQSLPRTGASSKRRLLRRRAAGLPQLSTEKVISRIGRLARLRTTTERATMPHYLPPPPSRPY